MRKINVCMIVKNLDLNGISSVVMNYLLHMDVNKYSFSIITGDSVANKYFDACLNNNITLYRLPVHKNVKYYMLLYKTLKDNKFDVVHINGSSATIGVELFIAYLCGIKNRVVHSHNSMGNHILVHFLLKPIVRILSTDKIACSESAGKWMFKKNYSILSNGFEIEQYKFDLKNREEIRKKLNVDDRIVIGHTGRINHQKNQKFLISLFEKLCKSNPKYALLLVGDGPEMNYIEELIHSSEYKDNIILYGSSNNVSKLYSAMDIFAFPSLYEGLGISALEAQINGLYCVASSNVPIQAKITDNIVFLNLNDEQKWIQIIENNCNRRNIDLNSDTIQLYNIKKNIFDLERIYLKSFNRK